MKTIKTGIEYFFELPKGCQFVDENGIVINSTKIVLEKKNEFEEFKALVKRMRKAQKRQEYTDSTLDREAMNECRKLTKQREYEVDEYLKKMEK